MTKTKNDNAGDIKDTLLGQALGERYLNYAMSTIVARSLPDVRDGLKPVHRRILYSMWENGNLSARPYRKSASSVGFAMMRYHPHGELAIYESLVRMAQDFSMRYPLIDGQGNFGSIDGDSAAAMRYTEARLSELGESLLNGLKEDSVDMVPNYNNEFLEPRVLPTAFPNLLANGAIGIAVGMATNIPPHNLGELCDALRHLVKHKDASSRDLFQYIPGPDFPTGGILVEDPETIMRAYETGRGGMRVRARWHVEELKGGLYQIVVTEIPYQVQKSRLIEKIADLILTKKIPLLADIQDESTHEIRMVLVPRSRTVDPAVLMGLLFKHSDLENRFNMNLNVVDSSGAPRVMAINEILMAFLLHRIDVLVRKSEHRLAQINHRLEVLEGFLIAYLNIDEVIRIIRFEDEPKDELMHTFNLSDTQAEAILNMRLKSLRKLEEMQIKGEHEELSKEKTQLEELIANESLQWKHVDGEIADLKKKYGDRSIFGKRRTSIEAAPIEIDVPLEAMIEKEPITIICSEKGWIRALKGHITDFDDIKYKEGDGPKFFLTADTTQKLLIFATNGRFYTLGCDRLPGGRGFGEPLRLMFELPNEEDVISMFLFKPDEKYIVAASDGRGFLVKSSDLVAQTKNGKQILSTPGKVRASICTIVNGDMIALIGENRKLLVFNLSEVPEMTKGRGVRLQFYRDGNISDVTTFIADQGLSWPYGSGVKTETDILPWLGRRGQSGRLAPLGFPRNNKFTK